MRRRTEGEPLGLFTKALVVYNREHGVTPVTMCPSRLEAIKFDPKAQEAIEFQRMHRADDLRTRERDRVLMAPLELP
ncbi:hypothetical protein HY383_02820 [Candidatus Daviesbacteria bacterium]|nr:hypothetical protein [Candidatus Daviesbacteria bacterium]